MNAVNKVSDRIIATVEVEEDFDNSDYLIVSLEDSFTSFNVDAISFGCQIQRGNVVSETAVHQIDGLYLQDNDINLFKGRYLNYYDDRENNVVLVDDKLAFLLFGTYDCIGEEVIIDGSSYVICGITESTEMKYQFSKYNVYTSLNALHNGEILSVSAAFSGTGIQDAKKIESSISNYGEYELYNTNVYKLRKKFWMYLILAAYMVIITIISVKWLKIAVVKLTKKTKELLLNKYFSDIYLWFSLRTFLILIATSSIITLLFFFFSKLYSCSWAYGEYIPQSLMELEYYREVIMKIRIDSNLGEPMKTFPQIQLTALKIYIYPIIILLCSSLVFYIVWQREGDMNLGTAEKDENES